MFTDSLFYVLMAGLLLIAFYLFCRYKVVKHFQQNVKVGDRCYYYIYEDTIYGNVTLVMDKIVFVVDVWGEVRRVRKDEIYPRMNMIGWLNIHKWFPIIFK